MKIGLGIVLAVIIIAIIGYGALCGASNDDTNNRRD